MLTILRDPSGITGREVHAFDRALTLQENIARAMPEGGADCEVYINGQRVDPLTDARLDLPPGADDLVTVAHRPRGFDPVTWAYIIAAVLTVAAYASAPKVPGETVLNESPNNKLTGQTNIARTYQGIPDVYGYRRVWPDLIQPSLVEYIDNVKYVTEWLCVSRGKGTVEAMQYADTPISDINGASFEVFEPASGPSPYPELNQTTLTNVLEGFLVPGVNGQEIKSASGVIPEISFRAAVYQKISTYVFSLKFVESSAFDVLKSIAGTGTALVETYGGPIDEDPDGGLPSYYETVTVNSFSSTGGFVTFTFTSTNDYWLDGTATGPYWRIQPLSGSPVSTVGPFTLPVVCDAIRWNIAFLRGLKSPVEIRAQFWKIDGAGAEIAGTRQIVNRTGAAAYSDDTFDQRYYTTTIYPTAGPGRYKIQFDRLNAENSTGSDIAKLEAVYAITRYATKTLPGVTVVKVITKATAQATGFNERKINCRWTRHVRQIDSTTLSASRNFARARWCTCGAWPVSLWASSTPTR
jgi:hypothetical protein